jgi:hypothetical protein
MISSSTIKCWRRFSIRDFESERSAAPPPISNKLRRSTSVALCNTILGCWVCRSNYSPSNWASPSIRYSTRTGASSSRVHRCRRRTSPHIISLDLAGAIPDTDVRIALRVPAHFVLGSAWRRRPDSNRGSGLCRPVPYHLATPPRRAPFREIPSHLRQRRLWLTGCTSAAIVRQSNRGNRSQRSTRTRDKGLFRRRSTRRNDPLRLRLLVEILPARRV